jgi:hypothetical protein
LTAADSDSPVQPRTIRAGVLNGIQIECFSWGSGPSS